jgi:hypothetical protein
MPRDGVDIAAQEYRKAQTYSNNSLPVRDALKLSTACFAVFLSANTCKNRGPRSVEGRANGRRNLEVDE